MCSESPQQITSLDMRGLYNKGLNISWTSYFEVGDWYDTVRVSAETSYRELSMIN